MCITHPNFPISLWFCFINQDKMTLNTPRLCCFNLKIPAFTTLEGEFQCRNELLDLLGLQVISGTISKQLTS